MATVYLAHDLRHDRKVAVKVLRPELAAVIGAERFLAEIKTTAALQHSHILPLFDSGQADGFLFYVMPFIEGESLRDRLKRERELPVDDAVRLAKEVASALDYAHRHGVIHRDIKPENILLQDGQALVADFGISLAVSQAGASRMTETGLSLGTPSYMSPEQATGERLLDARADVYSLGCLLYEMLVGEPPHTGPSVQAVIAAVVTKEPERLGARRPSVPANVEFAVHKALVEDPRRPVCDGGSIQQGAERAGHERDNGDNAGLRAGATRPSSKKLVSILVRGARDSDRARRLGMDAPTRADVHESLRALSAPRGDGVGWRQRRARRDLAGRAPNRVRRTRRGEHAPDDEGGRASQSGGASGYRQRDPIRSSLPTDARSDSSSTARSCASFRSMPAPRSRSRTRRIRPQAIGEAITTSTSRPTTGSAVFARRVARRTPCLRFRRTRTSSAPNGPSCCRVRKRFCIEFAATGRLSQDYEIVVQTLPRGEPRTLIRGVCARYSPSGHLLVVTADGKLLLVPFDLGKLALTGPPVALYEGLASDPFHCQVALSETGTLIYQTVGRQSSREMVWVNRDGLATLVDSQWKARGKHRLAGALAEWSYRSHSTWRRTGRPTSG